MMGPPQEVGCRVQILKDRATARYIGTVAGQDGMWVGVEWDDQSRGKHDGTTGGIKYFECKSGPTAGSFVRIEKVNFGTSVLEAVRARYSNLRGELGEVSSEELYVHTARNRKVQIELVGEEKIMAQQSQISLLTSARIVGASISYVGDAAELSSALPQLTELDLTCNLVASWSFAEQLCAALPGLQVLNLSDNALQLPTSPVGHSPLHNLRALILNDCGLSWQQVLVLEPLLPGLQELHLCGNSITSLAPAQELQQGQQEQQAQASAVGGQEAGQHLAPVTGFSGLQVLNMEDNALSEWSEVMRLSHLPSLSKLHLSNNPITNITYPQQPAAAAVEAAVTSSSTPATSGSGGLAPAAAGTSSQAPFARLEGLLLGNCQLASWDQVNVLGRFPALRELRLTGNPVLGLSKSGGRYEVIGRVPGISMLNGAEVKPRERRDAEIRYLQNILAEMEEAPDADARALVPPAHPRLKELVARYGEVLGTASRSAQGSSLAASMLELKLTCVAASQHAKMGTQVKKLPRSMTVSALKMLCEKLFKVKLANITLFLRAPGDPLPEDISAEEKSSLGMLGAQDGYEVLVDEVEAETKAAAEQAARAAELAAQEARLAEQLRAAELMQAEHIKSLGF